MLKFVVSVLKAHATNLLALALRNLLGHAVLDCHATLILGEDLTRSPLAIHAAPNAVINSG
ncbi:MAG TPA: hypothetical protein VHQ86_04090 [Candidatus Saccharimonadia bacterium]|nr:hypothetical protein [Candidatus Saccharimonadia bacterium]